MLSSAAPGAWVDLVVFVLSARIALIVPIVVAGERSSSAGSRSSPR